MKMQNESVFDLVAIGGGVGGLVASVGAAQLGAKAALVEKTKTRRGLPELWMRALERLDPRGEAGGAGALDARVRD